MSDSSTNLILPYLAAGQAQKHVTVNETIRKLDAIVQLAVESASVTAEPGAPSDGHCYIMPSGKTGTNWATFSDWSVGYYRDGAWEQISPREGWLAWVRDTGAMLVYDGSAWSTSDIRTGLGLGTAAVKNTGTSGDAVPVLNAANAWAAAQLSTLFGVTNTSAAAPRFTHTVTDAPADQKNWWNYGQAAALCFTTLNDAQNTTTTWLKVDRSGNAVTGLGWGHRLYPLTDNAYTLGAPSFRWSLVYAATGTINTSDAREKTELRSLSDAERAAIRRVIAGIGIFQWAEAVARKGADPASGGARLHCGVTAQSVEAAFKAEGLDARRYGLFCADPVFETVETAPERFEADEAGELKHTPAVLEQRPVIDTVTGTQMERLGVRYDQLLAMALGGL